MSHRSCASSILLTATLGMILCVAKEGPAQDNAPSVIFTSNAASSRDDAAAARAFKSIVPVLRHPRCINCHSPGDFPRQGDNRLPHSMNIRRGPEGEGVAGVKCNACHQDHNLPGLHVPPGAPDWHLPSRDMPMIWEGVSDRQLCELLKDPKQNGGRTVDQIVDHMSMPLVLWGWNPGEGRDPVPMPQQDFLSHVKEWAAKGAACPDR